MIHKMKAKGVVSTIIAVLEVKYGIDYCASKEVSLDVKSRMETWSLRTLYLIISSTGQVVYIISLSR